MENASHPFNNLRFTNHTIAASALGTAASTVLATISQTWVKSWEVFNMTGRNIELIIGADPLTSNSSGSVVFSPGTVSMTMALGVRAPIALSAGTILRARTIENTPVTIAATTPLCINLWG